MSMTEFDALSAQYHQLQAERTETVAHTSRGSISVQSGLKELKRIDDEIDAVSAKQIAVATKIEAEAAMPKATISLITHSTCPTCKETKMAISEDYKAATEAELFGYPSERAAEEETLAQELANIPIEECYVKTFAEEHLKQACSTLGIDCSKFPGLLEGMVVELEHCDITHGDPVTSAKIALVHLREDLEYYTKLKKAGL